MRFCVIALVIGLVATPARPAGTRILLGPPDAAAATVQQARAWAQARGATDRFVRLAALYWRLSPTRGAVRPEVAYAQSAKETGFGHFGGQVHARAHNPCGLRTRSGAGFKRFSSWRRGVTAHLDHLALYAGAEGYPRLRTPDPRHFERLLGTARTVEGLGGRWAPSRSYGTSIVRDYLQPLLATDAPRG